jgi:elongation factor 1-alpha
MTSEESQDGKKKHISLVVCGHVDAGKSTTTGHLIFKLGGISEREMAKLQAEADAQGKSSFAFAYYMDKDKAERERGVTINCTTKEFYTDSYHYTIVDAPGHRDYVKNMITGAGCADVALLLVPAESGGFETAVARGDHATGEVQGQTRQHAKLLGLLGIEKLIVGVNKMDSCDWSEARFNEIKEEMTKMITIAGFKPKQVPFIPYSGFRGENLVEPTDKMPWFKGWSANLSKTETISGVTLYDALEKLARPPIRYPDRPLRIPINGIYKIKGVGDVITGRIEQGTLNSGDIIRVAPKGLNNLKVFSIEMHHKTWPNAVPGDNVGMNIKGLDKTNMPKVGDVISLEKDLLEPVESFVCQVVVQDHPGQLKPGFSPCVHVRTAKSACKMSKIFWKVGKKTGNEKQEDPPFLEKGESGEIEFVPQQPIYLETFEGCQGLGRIAVMDSNQLVMLGKIMSVKYKPYKN